jgi:hypothetical protein
MQEPQVKRIYDVRWLGHDEIFPGVVLTHFILYIYKSTKHEKMT